MLLHVCCGPCAIFPYEKAREAGYAVECFFDNPNIEPEEEYHKREQAVRDWQARSKAVVHFGSYDNTEYQQCIIHHEVGRRCAQCFEFRLQRTALFAQQHGFAYFTTTLLVSPYQDQQLIREIGDRISQTHKSHFVFFDFRPGFRAAHNEARSQQLYLQKYCGCLRSFEERFKNKKQKIPT